MKQSIIPSLSFYLYIVICFTGSFLCLNAGESAIFHQQLNDQEINDQNVLDTYTTLRTIKRIHRDVQDQYDQRPEDNHQQQDFMIDIMVLLVSMYEKIVAATVTHYLMLHVPGQEDLQITVARIIAQDTVKIIAILGKQLMYFIFSQQMTWQEKLWYCGWVVTVIVIIKLGIDQISKSEKQKSSTPPLQKVSIPESIQEEQSHLSQQFGNYKRNS